MIYIAAYRGIGWVSKAIRLLTYSKYSHIGVLFTSDMEVEVAGKVHIIRAGNVIEAWQGGVRLSGSLLASHTPDTPVDMFEFKTPLSREQEMRAAQFLVSQLGKSYDYLNVLRFVPVVRWLFPHPMPSAWTRSRVFCSELAMEMSIEIGRPLLERCKPWEVPPRDPPRSPLLMPALNGRRA